MPDRAIRPEVLRRYYEAACGKQVANDDAFKGATFDEYFQLKRIQFPTISSRKAAEKSSRREFRKLADGMPPDPPREQGH